MADAGLTGPVLSPAARQVLATWLDQVGAALGGPARLRARIVAELDDGVHSAAEQHLATGTDPLDAARAAVAQFGDPDTVAASFHGELTAHLARRTGTALVGSGPLVGIVWLAALVPPLWPPRPAEFLGAHPLYLAVLAVAVPAALVAITLTGPLGHRLAHHPAHAARAATFAATACVVGDALLLTTFAHTAVATPTALSWPTAPLAVAVSATRLVLAFRAARRCSGGSTTRAAAPR
ncbi:permease prefix domain 1-containing protein [Pseudonocardia oceani]|uniref:Uncharacterized protein n=1 Tax=Pseudonocardia oceani TaxID=2792013 RepID=A0ABS6U2V1_9PSEU|nr:permease prefix domain 1-containing protein [Pseudonocardia oceani]MBW0126570.1 hypothetical protein [Pseudonocardia oceani]